MTKTEEERFEDEKNFHDEWAASEAEHIDPQHVNTALTSPELRHIHQTLGDISGKRLLDLGCGLGEAAVYFAQRGADVTAVDLSPGMLEYVDRFAKKVGVSLKTHVAAAEDLGLAPDTKFDIVYVGNLFHHVDIPKTLKQILPHMKEDAILASWDPVAYNPLINIYRRMAMDVRTVDEHPFRKKDVAAVRSAFHESKTSFYWLTTLVVFILMFLVERKNPNKVRFWKAVVDDADKWAWLYRPLEKLDRVLLKVLPPLSWLCWNVVIIAKRPIR